MEEPLECSQSAATSGPSSNRLGCIPTDSPHTPRPGRLPHHGSPPARGHSKAPSGVPYRHNALARANLPPISTTSVEGRQKILPLKMSANLAISFTSQVCSGKSLELRVHPTYLRR